MEFNELQAIWDNQDNETVYTINEEALYEQIKQKSGSVDRILKKVELFVIGANILVSIFLVIDAFLGDRHFTDFIVPIAYLGYALLAIYLRANRRQEEIRFAPTMLGELEKGIWQAEYLIKRSQQMMIWYMIPILLLVILYLTFNGNGLLALGVTAVVVPLSYFGGRWEINRFYRPKLRDLEALRATLLESES